MPYCDLEDVRARLPHMTISETSTPSEDDVTAWCALVSSAIIDPELRTLVSLPVTDVSGLAYLKETAVSWVVAEYYRSQRMESEAADRYQREFESRMKRVRENPGVVQPPRASESGPSSSRRQTPEYRREEPAW